MSNEQRKIKVLVADDSPIVREGMKTLLASQVDMELVNLAQCLRSDSSAQQDLHTDVVLFDFSSTTSMSEISKKYPLAKIVVFSEKQSEEHIYRAIQAGVRGYLDKKACLDEILDCIRAVNDGQTWIPQPVADRLAKRMATPQLTTREREVLLQIAQGKNNKQIGAVLGLCEGTVKVYVTHILGKLKVSGRLEALATANSRGLILPLDSPDFEKTTA